MKIYILTLFPKMFVGPLTESVILHAQKKGIFDIEIINIRDFTANKHKTVDDTPYGGGPGMVMKVDVVDRALQKIKLENRKWLTENGKRYGNQKTENRKKSNFRFPRLPAPEALADGGQAISKPISNFQPTADQPQVDLKPISDFKSQIILLTPQGKTYNQKVARRLAKYQNLILIAGHFEGYDERIRSLVDEEISIGDYILTGGEIPAMVLVDSIARLISGVVGKKESLREESFSQLDIGHSGIRHSLEIRNSKIRNLLEYPQYTRPPSYTPKSISNAKPIKVPKILLSGNHQKIASWRLKKSIERTKKRRADLLS